MRDLQKQQDSGIQLVEFDWPLNAHWADETMQTLKHVVDQGAKRIIINMENVPFIDSHGLAALLNGLGCLDSVDSDCTLVAPQPQAKLFLRISKFDRVFRIYDNLGEVSAA